MSKSDIHAPAGAVSEADVIGIGHQLSNLLLIVLGNADLVLETRSPSDPITADLREIRQAAISAGVLARQLQSLREIS